ncbi:MAG TPA: sterol desaturase family protein [Beijerinckia sp.]|nr:sterol desaturase family protein [Beijerinckia sp.]
MVNLIDAGGILPWWLPLSVLTWAVQMVAYHSIGLAFEWCDRTKRLAACKVRDVDRLGYIELLPRVLINQLFILLPSMVALQWAGLAFTGAPHLSPLRFITNMVLMGIGHDIVQYIAHRHILHRADLMRKLGHGLHHSTGASKSISACYMSSTDFFLEIVLPYLVPLALVGGGGADIFFHCFVASLGAFGGLYEHSGYDFAAPLPKTRFYRAMPRLAGWVAAAVTSKAHAEHHRRSNVSFSDGFGSPGICDTLFGTRWDKAGEASRADGMGISH